MTIYLYLNWNTTHETSFYYTTCTHETSLNKLSANQKSCFRYVEYMYPVYGLMAIKWF